MSPNRAPPTSTDGLCGSPLQSGNGRVEQLLRGAEDRIAEHRFDSPGHGDRREARCHQTSQGAEGDSAGEQHRAPGDTEPIDDRPHERDLQQDSQQRGRCVEHGEEPQQPGSLGDRGRLQLEHVVQHPFGGRGETTR